MGKFSDRSLFGAYGEIYRDPLNMGPWIKKNVQAWNVRSKLRLKGGVLIHILPAGWEGE
jgi:hypothetical protein